MVLYCANLVKQKLHFLESSSLMVRVGHRGVKWDLRGPNEIVAITYRRWWKVPIHRQSSANFCWSTGFSRQCVHALTSPLPAIDLFLQLLEVLGKTHAPLSEGHPLLLQITGTVRVRASPWGYQFILNGLSLSLIFFFCFTYSFFSWLSYRWSK